MILTTVQHVKNNFIPRGYGIPFIVFLYLCLCVVAKAIYGGGVAHLDDMKYSYLIEFSRSSII